jgi:hypothetical protein
MAWTSLVRGRSGIGAVTRGVVAARREAAELAEAKNRQPTLFDIDWQDTGHDTQGKPARDIGIQASAEES